MNMEREMGMGMADQAAGQAAEQAAQVWRDVFDSSLECELCNEPYDDATYEHLPRLLTCGHTFCESCLDDWANVGFHTQAQTQAQSAQGQGQGYDENHWGDDSRAPLAEMECPTCRTVTRFPAQRGVRGLPKNFELLRVRQEIELHTQQQVAKMERAWAIQVRDSERATRAAQADARDAQLEAEREAERAARLAQQVALNAQEKRDALARADEARQRAQQAAAQATALQRETRALQERLAQEATQRQQVQRDAHSATEVAQQMQQRAVALQKQVDQVRAQLALHAGHHDPATLVVLVEEPTTAGSWLRPYTRYTVLSMALPSREGGGEEGGGGREERGDREEAAYQVARRWLCNRHGHEATPRTASSSSSASSISTSAATATAATSSLTAATCANEASSVKVYRRYSDFVWLQQALTRRFPLALVPALPGKHWLAFTTDRAFVGDRMRALQAFVRAVLRQPTLAGTEEVRAFLLATTEELATLRALAEAVAPLQDTDVSSQEEAVAKRRARRRKDWMGTMAEDEEGEDEHGGPDVLMHMHDEASGVSSSSSSSLLSASPVASAHARAQANTNANASKNKTTKKKKSRVQASASVSSSSAWAWGAVSALTSSAAKLVTSTGSVLSTSMSQVASSTTGAGSGGGGGAKGEELGGTSRTSSGGGGGYANGTSTAVEISEQSLSSSLTLDFEDDSDGEEALDEALLSPDSLRRRTVRQRRRCIEIARAHDVLTQRGSRCAHATRASARHLHGISQLLQQMDALDHSHASRYRERWLASATTSMALSPSVDMAQSTYTDRQVEADARSCLESRSFQGRASDAFSAQSLAVASDADCMELALLEVARMQTLQLDAIEEAFTRLRGKEQVLQEVALASDGSVTLSSSNSNMMATSEAHAKEEELVRQRQELMRKVREMEPARSATVLTALQRGAREMQELAHTRRRFLEDTRATLLAGSVPMHV